MSTDLVCAMFNFFVLIHSKDLVDINFFSQKFLPSIADSPLRHQAANPLLIIPRITPQLGKHRIFTHDNRRRFTQYSISFAQLTKNRVGAYSLFCMVLPSPTRAVITAKFWIASRCLVTAMKIYLTERPEVHVSNGTCPKIQRLGHNPSVLTLPHLGGKPDG